MKTIPWQSYDLLLFDFDDTLVDFSVSEVAAVTAVCRLHGQAAKDHHIESFRTINRALWARLERGEVSRDVVFHDRFAAFFAAHAIKGDIAEANDVFLAALADAVTPYDGAVTLLERLARTTKVGIVTNGHGPTQRRRAQRAGLADFVAVYVISDEVGYSKPHRAIFDIAYARAELPPGKKTLMIGDSYKADVEGAMAAGFDACWVAHGRPLPVGEGAKQPSYVINSLADVSVS